VHKLIDKIYRISFSPRVAAGSAIIPRRIQAPAYYIAFMSTSVTDFSPSGGLDCLINSSTKATVVNLVAVCKGG